MSEVQVLSQQLALLSTIMEGATLEGAEPIFEFAVKCERLYTVHIARLEEDRRTNDAAILSELSQRFAAWAAFLGVFAESKICLDSRLRNHGEIQERILRLLDVMARNLTFVSKVDDSPEPTKVEPLDTQQHLSINTENLEAIYEAIERLNSIGIAIRQSSVTSHIAKARKFAETFDFASFEEFAYLALKTKYIAASEGLLQMLTRSMIETYALFLHRKSRYEKLQAPRSEPQTSVSLPTISERSAADVNAGSAMDLDQQISQQSRISTPQIHRPPPNSRRALKNITSSEPTSVDSKELRAKVRKMLSPSKKGATTSILTSQADYPRPAKETMNCEWCFSPLPTNVLEGDKWPKHVDEDHKPYLCFSERCPESSPRFATRREWREHMLTTHGQDWHREAYAPPSWVCPLCNGDDAAFSIPDELASHLADSHGKSFTQPQIQAIVQQSQVRSVRPQNECLLCCLPIKAQQNPTSKEKGESSKETSTSRRSRVAADVDRSRKRIRTEVSFTESAQQVRSNSYQTPMDYQQQESKNQAISHPTEYLTVETIATHVAGHLQAIMALTLRMISIDGELGVSVDNQSEHSGADDYSSGVRSVQINTDQESYTMEASQLPEDSDTDYYCPDKIPDSAEHFTSNNAFPANDTFDDFLHKLICSGAFQLRPGENRTLRIRGVPLAWDAEQLHDFLQTSSGDAQPRVKSLALEVHKPTQTATATFRKVPQQLQSGKNWIIPVSSDPSHMENGFINLDNGFAGITTLYSPPPDDHVIDIIAIPGIGGHAFGSFKERSGEHMWLRDALPYDITRDDNNTPISRVMIHGHDSSPQNSNSFQNMEDFGTSFHSSLRSMAIAGSFRPIIIVAHSLGGLIVKETLISLSKSGDEEDQKLLRAVYGIVFFGVPRDDMDIKSLTSTVGNGPGLFLLKLIGYYGSQLLSIYQGEFPKALGGQGESKIVCFYETLQSPTAKRDERGTWQMTGPVAVLVSKSSATHCRPWETGPEHICAINRTHSDMVKFGPEDSEYEKVLKRIQSLVREARKVQETREAHIAQNHALPPALSQQAQDCLKSLAFDNMGSRSLEIEPAVSGTCEWLFQHETFEKWARFNQEILWIKGKPGSGKSTLLNYAFTNQKLLLSARDSDIVLSFFFHGDGVDLQKTPLGFFRSLLYQILQQMPDCLSDLVDTFRKNCEEIGDHGEKWQWHPRELCSAFESSLPEILKGRSVWLFVDALDECGEDNAKDLVKKFKLLFKRANALSVGTNHLHICFSCRHYPILSSPGLAEVCLERENQADIRTYVKSEMLSFTESSSFTILDSIIGRASGVFLWAKLVVKRIQHLALDGAGPTEIKGAVEYIPKDLELLYNQLIRNMRPASLKLIQWILFATRPLSVEELRWAMAIDADCSSLQACQNALDYVPDDKRMRQRILSLSQGLAEITLGSDTHTVQFIHQSVKDFFLDKGLLALHNDYVSIDAAIGMSHSYLFETCICYLAMEEINKMAFDMADSDQIVTDFPFLDYATTSWVSHMKQSDDHNVFTEQLLQLLAWPSNDLVALWTKIYNKLRQASKDCPSVNTNIVHIAARYGIPGVMNVILQKLGQVTVEADLKDDNGQTPLSLAAEEGHTTIVEVLLATGQAEINSKDTKYGQTPLSWAAEKGHEAVVKLLLATGQAEINSKDTEYGQTPLSWAAEKGHEAVVKLLLATGQAEINSKDTIYGQTPLSWAAEKGHEAVVKLLLATGQADINSNDEFNRTPLSLAAGNGHEAVVKLLQDYTRSHT